VPRLEPEGPPDLSHRGMADLVLGLEGVCRPVRGVGRCALERLDHDRFDHVFTDGARRPRTRGVNEAVETSFAEAAPPLTHRHRVTAQVAPRSGPGCDRRRRRRGRSWRRRADAWDDECRRAQRSSAARSAALRLISTVGRPRLAMAFLRCWRITPDQLGPTERIPAQLRFVALQPSGTEGAR
jgi:hypothetical protein